MTPPAPMSEAERLRHETERTIDESKRLREQLAATAARLEVFLPLLEEEVGRYQVRVGRSGGRREGGDVVTEPEPTEPGSGHGQVMTDAEVAAKADDLVDRMNDLTQTIGLLSGQQKRSWRAILGSYGLWVVDIALIVALSTFGYHVSTTSECQAKQNDAFRDASVKGREAATKQDQQQLDDIDRQIAFLDTILNPSGNTPERNRQALLDYKQSRIDSKNVIVGKLQTRADNPLPNGNCS